jgi:hypothetical protein
MLIPGHHFWYHVMVILRSSIIHVALLNRNQSYKTLVYIRLKIVPYYFVNKKGSDSVADLHFMFVRFIHMLNLVLKLGIH